MTAFSSDDLRLLVTPKDLRERVTYLRDRGCHIIAPGGGSTSFIAQSFGVAQTVLDLDVDPSAGQVYQDPTLMQPDQYSLSRLTLQLLSLSAGVSWLPSSTCTSDPGVKLLWRFHAGAEVRSYDGQKLTIDGTSEVDLRDGSPQMGGWSPAKWRYLIGKNEALIRAHKATRDDLHWDIHGWDERLAQRTRKHGLRLAETKAKNAAVRALGVKSSYTLEELARPFVVLRVIYIPDMSIEAIRTAVHYDAMHSTAVLYPQRQAVGQ